MKSKILLFFFWGSCFNIVASYHTYSGYRQGANHQQNNWSSNQNYAKKPNPTYTLRRPAANYVPPKPVVNYVQGLAEPNYVQVLHEPKYVQNAPEQKYVQLQHEPSFQELKPEQIYTQRQQEVLSQQLQQQVVDSQPEIISEEIEEQPSVALQQGYPGPRPYLALTEKSYDTYGGAQPSSWQPEQAPSPVYVPDSYPSQVSRQWSRHKSYIPGPPIPQPAPYPNWQSSGFKIIQQKQNGSPFDEQNIYYAPMQYTAQPQVQAASAASANSENNYRDLLASKPEIKKYLTSASQKKRFILIHANGTNEFVDVVDDSLLGNSQIIKSSDIINDFEEDLPVKYQESSIYNNIVSLTSLSDNQKINPNENEGNEFLPHPRPNVPQQSKPGAMSVNEDRNKKYYNPRYDKTNYVNNIEASTIPPPPHVAKSVDRNNYHHNLVYKPAPSQPHKNRVVEQNKSAQSPRVWHNDNSYGNAVEQQKSKTDIIFTMRDTNDKIYDNDSPPNKENIKNYYKPLFFDPAKRNIERSSTSTTESVESNVNNYQNPNYDFSQANDKNDYYNPSGNRYANNPSWPHNNHDDTTVPVEYTATSTYDAIDSNPLNEATAPALPYHYRPSNNSDETNTSPTFATPESSNDELSDNNDENKVSEKQSNDDTSSNVQRYPEDDPHKDKYDYDVVTNTPYTTLVQTGSTDSENTNVGDGAVDETETATQDTKYEKCSDEDQQSKVESTKNINSSVDDIRKLSSVERESPLNEDFPTDNDTLDTGDEEEAEKLETIDIEAKPGSASDDIEVEVDFANLKNVNKSMFWFRPDTDFWDKLYSSNDTAGYDSLFVFNLKIAEPVDTPVIEKTSRSYVCENGANVEDLEEITWANSYDDFPTEIKITKIIRNPGPEQVRPRKNKAEQTGRKTDGEAALNFKP